MHTIPPGFFQQPDGSYAKNAPSSPVAGFSADAGPESDLHDKIAAECKRRGWLAVHSRMDKRATNQIGTPDFIIARPGGRILWIEAKSKGRKLTPEQAATIHWLKNLGHDAHAVWSFEQFIEIVRCDS